MSTKKHITYVAIRARGLAYFAWGMDTRKIKKERYGVNQTTVEINKK